MDDQKQSIIRVDPTPVIETHGLTQPDRSARELLQQAGSIAMSRDLIALQTDIARVWVSRGSRESILEIEQKVSTGKFLGKRSVRATLRIFRM